MGGSGGLHEQGGGRGGGADAGDLDRPGRHAPGAQRAQVPGEALVAGLLGPGAGEVVVAADQPGHRPDDHGRRPGARGRAQSGAGGRGGGQRRAAEQGDRPSGVVGPPPRRAGGTGVERARRGQSGAGGRRPGQGEQRPADRRAHGVAAGTGGTGWVSSAVPYLPEVP